MALNREVPTRKIVDEKQLSIIQRRAMSESLKELWKNNLHTDIKLECNGGTINAHKLILIGSCPYFKMMFTNDMTENINGCVQFPTFTLKAMRIIIEYLYGFEITKCRTDLVLLKEVIEICHLMQLEYLLEFCWDVITSSLLNVANFAELWAFADAFELLLKANKAIEKFACNNIEAITGNGSIVNFKEDQMVKLILMANLQKPCDVVAKAIIRWRRIQVPGLREKAAVNLFKLINLKKISTDCLQKIMLKNVDKSNGTVENVLINEIMLRLLSQTEVNKANGINYVVRK